MKRLLVFVIGLLVMVGTCRAQPNDPPQRIWFMEAPRINRGGGDGTVVQYFYDWTWIGDQNGDGCDELLICQEPLLRGERGPADPANRVELFLGDPHHMSDQPAFVFNARDSLETMGLGVANLGALTARDAHDFAIWTATYFPNQDGGDRRQYYDINIYRGGEGRFDTIPDFVIRRPTDPNDRFGFGGISLPHLSRPCDINGDGFDDLLVYTEDFNGRAAVSVFYGGADFDTTEDVTINADVAIIGDANAVATGDLNGDGKDDIIVRSYRNFELDFFLGGNPPTGQSVMTITQDQYAGLGVYVFNAIPDVNGDGYDDWVIGLDNPQDPYGEQDWLFFGSDTLDAQPDRVLAIDPYPVYGGPGIYGGDMNGDRRGDVIARGIDLRIFFGSSWFDTHAGAVLNNWFTRSQGAYGDFNGDGAGDLVLGVSVDQLNMSIYAGNRNWVVSVSDKDPIAIPEEFTASAYPNPFNDQSVVTFQLPTKGALTAHLYDLAGREVKKFELQVAAPGSQSLLISGSDLSSGIYYLVADLNSATRTFKTSIKLVHIK